MLQNSSEFNSVGGGYGGWGGFGGMNGVGLFGLIGLLGRRGLSGEGGDDCCADNRNLAVLAAIANAKDQTVAEGRDLAAAICTAKEQSAAQAYAAAIQAANNTQAVKDQATAFAIVNDKRFDDLATQGAAQTAAILAKITQTEIDGLRDQLAMARKHGDHKELEITMIQNQNQQQQQQQVANFDLHRRFDSLFAQVNKASQDVINFGTMAASANQANQQTNVK